MTSEVSVNRPEVIVSDITTLDVDAIVNAANRELIPGGGVCGAIHRAAGPELAKASRRLAPCETGDAKITPGFDLPAKFVIHSVGPIYEASDHEQASQLASCYRSSLDLAHENKCDSIAFPCISTGVYGYPLEEAAQIAIDTIHKWLSENMNPTDVVCCCFSERDAAVYQRLLVKPTV